MTSPLRWAAETVVLRPLTEADCAGPYPSWLNDPEVCRYNSHNRVPYTRQDALAYVAKSRVSETERVLAIVDKASGRHVGNIALQNINLVDRSAELSILIGEKEFWGKGLSREAGRLLLDHGFLTLDLWRIGCATPRENLPMRKLALSLGMVEEGCRRQALFKEGRYLDIVEYGVLKPEYLKRFHAQ